MTTIDTFENSKDALMRIRFLISRGYVYYTEGKCKARDQEKLHFKFSDRYRTELTRDQRSWAAKKGNANVMVVWLENHDKETMDFWLLATEGNHLIFELETMKDARKKNERLKVLDNKYVLLKEPRPGDVPRWTWKLTDECYAEWKNNIRLAIRHKKEMTLKQLHFSLVRIHGFSAARKQGFALLRYFEQEWKRSRKEPFPFGGSYIGYLKVTNNKGKKQ